METIGTREAEGHARLLTASEVAPRLFMSERGVMALAREGRIPKRKVGKRVLFEAGEIDAWIRNEAGKARREGPNDAR